MGCIYKRGDVYWIEYYRNGKPYQESTKSKKEKVAKDLLKGREEEIAKGEVPGIHFDKIRFEEIAEDYLNDYRINQRKSLKKAEQYAEYLKKSFEGFRVVNINTARIKDHINRRIEGGFANATINRKLSALKRMFSLATECSPKKVRDIFHIPMLKESNVRKGFFEYDQFMAIREAFPDYLKPIVTLAYHTGWRKGEVSNLTWDKVDMRERTKGKLFHDFMRTAARNMIRSGIPERVAMTITGHKTRSVFVRYNIVSDQDLKEAARKQQLFIESQNGYIR
jgi:integrase